MWIADSRLYGRAVTITIIIIIIIFWEERGRRREELLRICLQFRPHQGYDSARVRPLVALPSSAALVNPTVWVFFCAQCLRPLPALASSVALVNPTVWVFWFVRSVYVRSPLSLRRWPS